MFCQRKRGSYLSKKSINYKMYEKTRKLRDITPRPTKKYLSVSIPTELNPLFEDCNDVTIEITQTVVHSDYAE